MTRLILLSDKDPSGVTEILRGQIIRSKQKKPPQGIHIAAQGIVSLPAPDFVLHRVSMD